MERLKREWRLDLQACGGCAVAFVRCLIESGVLKCGVREQRVLQEPILTPHKIPVYERFWIVLDNRELTYGQLVRIYF